MSFPARFSLAIVTPYSVTGISMRQLCCQLWRFPQHSPIRIALDPQEIALACWIAKRYRRGRFRGPTPCTASAAAQPAVIVQAVRNNCSMHAGGAPADRVRPCGEHYQASAGYRPQPGQAGGRCAAVCMDGATLRGGPRLQPATGRHGGARASSVHVLGPLRKSSTTE